MNSFRNQPFPGAGGAYRVVDGELVADTGTAPLPSAPAPTGESTVPADESASATSERTADDESARESITKSPASARRRRQHQE